MNFNNSDPAITHKFIKKLYDLKILLQVLTMNVDGLEKVAGLP
jgi:NAD-dependent SIR2 family protein deacetylase